MDNSRKTAGWDTVIRPRKGWLDIDIKGLVRYRDLILLMVKRNFTVLYKQTVLGPAWVVIQPLLTTLVFTVAQRRRPSDHFFRKRCKTAESLLRSDCSSGGAGRRVFLYHDRGRSCCYGGNRHNSQCMVIGTEHGRITKDRTA